jgi:FKBP-type peptidyl-prolyl cis-trans isomerase SlyD
MMHIKKNSVVSIRYTMKNGGGSILEDRLNNPPVSYLHGSNGILPILQSQLEGLVAGDTKTVFLAAASGLTDEDFVFHVIIDDVRPAMQEEILLGYPVKPTGATCDAGCDCHG